MIEEGFNNADSAIKEMTDFFETRLDNLKPKVEKKNLQQLPRKPTTRKVSRSVNKKTLAPVL